MKVLKIILIVLAVLLIIAGVIGTYYYYNKYQKEKIANTDLKKQIDDLTKKLQSCSSEITSTANTKSSDAAKSCAEFSAKERAEMTDWKTYTNDTYHYSFKYPADWTVAADSPELVTVKGADSGEEIIFKVYEGRSEIDLTGLTRTFTRDFKANCENSTENTYDGADNFTMMTYTFTKSGNPYLIQFSYKDIGASYSGDIYDIDKMMLKTFTFSS